MYGGTLGDLNWSLPQKSVLKKDIIMNESDITNKDVQCGEMNLDNLKNEINLFLFKWLPDKLTLIEVERLACKIHEMIEDTHKNRNN